MRLIDADKLECACATMPHEASDDYKQGYLDGFSYSFEIIDEQPTIDPVPQLKWERDTAIEQLRQLGYCFGEKVKRGRWVKLDIHPHLADHKCTACGESAYVPTCMGEPMYLFCPNCGALMREDGGDG